MGYMKTLFLYDYEFKVDFCNTFISLSKLDNSKNCNLHTDKDIINIELKQFRPILERVRLFITMMHTSM